MRFLVSCLLLAVSTPHAVEATLGVDVSTDIPPSAWNCLVSEGYTFAIVRVYQSTGQVDPISATTINNARASGIASVDGYVFPCFSCGNPAGQIQDTINNLNANGAVVGQLWLDIEGTEYWGSNCDDNINFIRGLVDECSAQRMGVGIYSSKSQWDPITCSTTDFGDLPIWYAHYDQDPSFNDWDNFGGWTKPGMKQYEGDIQLCEVGVDMDFY